MRSIILILQPDLKVSGIKVRRLLQEGAEGRDRLLLNIPREMEALIDEFASSEISYEDVIARALSDRLVPEPAGSWECAAKPILEALPQLSRRFPRLLFRCYGSLERDAALMSNATRMACLILRTTLTGGGGREDGRLRC